jgi:prevent-host-death family protein
MKTVSVRELSQGGASKVVAAAHEGPVLVTKNGEPAAWVIDAAQLAAVGRRLGGSRYEQAMAALAVDLYDKEVLSLGRAARLAGVPIGELIELAGEMHVPVLRRPPDGLAVELADLEAALDESGQSPGRLGVRAAALSVAPVPYVSPGSVTVVARAEGQQPASAGDKEAYFTVADDPGQG